MSPIADELRRGDVRDIRALARRALDDGLQANGGHLPPHLREDAEQLFVEIILRLWERYDASKGPSFSTWAYRILRFRLTDFYRGQFGDSRYGQNAIPTSLDAEEHEQPSRRDSGFEDVASAINTVLLTPESRNVLERLARPMVEEGLTMDMAAARVNWTRKDASKALKQLEIEFRAL